MSAKSAATVFWIFVGVGVFVATVVCAVAIWRVTQHFNKAEEAVTVQRAESAAQARADAVFDEAEPVISANVRKHEAIRNAILAAPASDDAPMAPVLRDTFDRMYPSGSGVDDSVPAQTPDESGR